MISKERNVYSFGSNDRGQLGFQDYTNTDIPKRVIINDAINVKCGFKRACLMTKHGIFTCGDNKYGQLGICQASQEIEMACTFQIVNIQHVVSIGCGNKFTILLDKNGDTYFCGITHGEHDKCVRIPTKISFTKITKIVSVKCGHTFIICVDSDRNIFSLGRNYYGQLGIGKSSDKFSPEQISLPKVISFKTCADHVIVRTIDTIWGFGRNQYKQLGNDDGEYVYLPRKIDL